MNIDEMKDKKRDLEEAISSLVKEFESETKIKVSSIDFSTIDAIDSRNNIKIFHVWIEL